MPGKVSKEALANVLTNLKTGPEKILYMAMGLADRWLITIRSAPEVTLNAGVPAGLPPQSYIMPPIHHMYPPIDTIPLQQQNLVHTGFGDDQFNRRMSICTLLPLSCWMQ